VTRFYRVTHRQHKFIRQLRICWPYDLVPLHRSPSHPKARIAGNVHLVMHSVAAQGRHNYGKMRLPVECYAGGEILRHRPAKIATASGSNG